MIPTVAGQLIGEVHIGGNKAAIYVSRDASVGQQRWKVGGYRMSCMLCSLFFVVCVWCRLLSMVAVDWFVEILTSFVLLLKQYKSHPKKGKNSLPR